MQGGDIISEKTIVLRSSDGMRKLFSKVVVEEHDGITVSTVNGRRSVLRKMLVQTDAKKVIIANDCINSKLFDNNKKIHTAFSHQILIPVLNKICRQIAEKYSCTIPFREIYILADPAAAYRFICAIGNISRLFTVVSREKISGYMYDELYFKHSIIVRHITSMKERTDDESLIVRLDTSLSLNQFLSPLLDLSDTPVSGEKIVQAERIFISDKTIRLWDKHWRGKSGVAFFDAVGRIPDEEAEVDINKTADKIFLLDTTKI